MIFLLRDIKQVLMIFIAGSITQIDERSKPSQPLRLHAITEFSDDNSHHNGEAR